MAENKTQPHDGSVEAFLDAVPHPRRREDARMLAQLMREVTGHEPVLWGPGMVGFGRYHYRYESGREGDWFLTGFAPRKAHLVVYIMSGFSRYDALLSRLGKHKTGKACLYLNKLADVDLEVLREMVRLSVEHMAKTSAG